MKRILIIALFALLLFSFGSAVALPTAFIQNGGHGNNINNGNLYDYTAPSVVMSKETPGDNGKNDVDAIPEPASLILLGLGLVGVRFFRRYK